MVCGVHGREALLSMRCGGRGTWQSKVAACAFGVGNAGYEAVDGRVVVLGVYRKCRLSTEVKLGDWR